MGHMLSAIVVGFTTILVGAAFTTGLFLFLDWLAKSASFVKIAKITGWTLAILFACWVVGTLVMGGK